MNRYFIVGDTPVKCLERPDGGTDVLKLNWKTGAFEYGMDLFPGTLRNDDTDELDEDAFIQAVEVRRARIGSDNPAVIPLYAMMVAIEDRAREERRPLTDEEKSLLASLRGQTHAARGD